MTEWGGGRARAADGEDIATRRISPDGLTGGFTLPPMAATIVAHLLPTAGHGHLDRVARLHEHGAREPQEVAAVFNDLRA